MTTKHHNIAIIGFDGMQSIDYTGPLEAFFKANQYAPHHQYIIHTIGLNTQKVHTGSGLTIELGGVLAQHRQRFDTIIIPGGTPYGVEQLCGDQALLNCLQQHSKTQRVVSICTGAFVLAAAGLLKHRMATTHWQSIADFRQRFPETRINDEALYVQDGNIYTSAGITAGIDLSLALIEKDCRKDVALKVAQELVIHLKRPADQGQLSSVLQTQFLTEGKIRKVIDWMSNNLNADFALEQLAERSAMSVRNFARQFKLETGTTPAQFANALRLQHAKMLIQETNLPLKKVAFQCGFGSNETLRRAFNKQFGVAPVTLRKQQQTVFPKL